MWPYDAYVLSVLFKVVVHAHYCDASSLNNLKGLEFILKEFQLLSLDLRK